MARRKTTEVQDQTTDPALNLIVSHLEAIEREQRLIAASLGALRSDTDSKFVQLHTQLAREKAEAQQGLQAALDALYKQIETQPRLSQEELARQLETVKQEAEKQSADKSQRFRETLRDAPTGNIISHEEDNILLQINRVQLIIKPGLNANVPQPFIELWEDRAVAGADAKSRQKIIEGMHDFGYVEQWRYNGKQGDISELPSGQL